MILYLLDHRHWIDDEYFDTKFIGIFSSHTLVHNTIEHYSNLPGFCNFTSGFHVESVNISNVKSFNSRAVYILTTTQILDDDEEITVSYCIYLNLFHAKLAQMMKSIVSYSKKREKNYVSKHILNRSEWAEGFEIIC